MRSGKTYLAKYMLTKYGFPSASFATQLKEDLVNLGIQPELIHVTKPPIVRKLMQVYGQAQRYQDPDYWMRYGMAYAMRLRGLTNETVPVVFDDVRFVNEADAIRRQGGIIVRLENVSLAHTDDDVSETELDDYEFDHRISVGLGQLEELQEAMDDVLWVEGVLHD